MTMMTRTELMTSVILPRLEGDSALTTALGGLNIYMSQSSVPVIIPSIHWTVIQERLLENYWRVEVQFDFWCNTSSEADTIRKRIRAVLHKDQRRTLGSVDMSTLYLEGRHLGYKPPSNAGSEEQPGAIHEMLRFRFDLARERYTT